MSAVAKLLLHAGVKVSGSDVQANDQTELLKEKGATIHIGESAEHIPDGCECVIVTSAAPMSNRERLAAQERKIPEMTNFAFLGQWFSDSKTIVVAGTHGKSTTTAMLGLALEAAGMDPTVIVGSKVPDFPDGNLRIGREDLFVVEGDEYARHFLEFEPFGLVLTNIELDHVDVFTSMDALLESFHELTGKMKSEGILVANMSDDRVRRLLETEAQLLAERGVRILPFTKEDANGNGLELTVPGEFNRMNATAAKTMAEALGADPNNVENALADFTGIWRRFELLGTKDGYRVYSDYGHHPTAVLETLKAVKETFPDQRTVLCFQPHHRNRTKVLFNEFVSSFDEADVLILSEIYAVAGRDEDDDKDVSSENLVEAIRERDREHGRVREVVFGGAPKDALAKTFELAAPRDIVIVMSAGDIDNELRTLMDV